MKLIRYFIQAFSLIFLVAVIGLLFNLNRLSQISKYHEEIAEEWVELNSLVRFQNRLNELITYISFHQVVKAPSKSIVEKKISQARDSLNEVRVCALDETAHHHEDAEGHAEKEARYLNELQDQYKLFAQSIEASISKDEDSLQTRLIDGLSRLLNVQTKAFALQLVYVEGMQDALNVADMVHRQVSRQTYMFSIIMIIILACASVFGIIYLRRRTNAVLEQQNLMTIGALTNNLIHEIRNPLGIIKSSASVLKRESKDNETSQELIGYMVEEIDRIDNIFKHLLNLQKSKNIPFNDENVAEIINKVIVLFEGELDKNKLTIKFINNAKDKTVCCNASLLRQVLINLLLNAIQASEEGDEILIQTDLGSGSYKITITDYGVGIPSKELKRIFDVFYTTKSKGMGIGLLIVKSIIDRHHGHIDINSKIGEGTTFEIKLPYEHK